MQNNPIRIGTRESQLAVWQATLVKNLLEQNGYKAELVFIKSEGDIDLVTPLYAMGVQGVFTRSLDIALLNHKIDIAVHSMKDVPVQLPDGIAQAAVIKRASYKDILVAPLPPEGGTFRFSNEKENKQSGNSSQSLPFGEVGGALTIATSSIRRKAQWLHRYPNTIIENLRGNVNTRLKKVAESNWHGAIFAAAGLERLGFLIDDNIISPSFGGVGEALDWMLPAPAQGAIMVAARNDDSFSLDACSILNDESTAISVKAERDFLSALMGGCSTPISALAQLKDGTMIFKGNIVSPDGKEKAVVEEVFNSNQFSEAGRVASEIILKNGGREVVNMFKNAR